jgi:hypothetical protein
MRTDRTYPIDKVLPPWGRDLGRGKKSGKEQKLQK